MEQKQSALFSAIAYSYIYFIDDYLAVLNNPAYHSATYIDEDIASTLKEMQTLFLSMPSLLGGEADFKEIYAKKLVAFRTLLEDKYRNLHALQRELQHITSYYSLKATLTTASYEDFGMTEEEAREMEFSTLAKDCTSYVFAENDPIARQQRAGNLLTYIPMRMTKESFLNYVEKALFRIHIEDCADSALLLTGILRQQFEGYLYGDYKKSFTDLRLSIEELFTIDDTEDFYDTAELVNETLEYTVNLVSKLHHMVCTFSNFLIFDALSFETLTDMHVSFYDLYCSLQNVLNGHEDAPLLLETLPERVEDIKEQLQQSYEKACKHQQAPDSLFVLMQTYLHMSIHHVFGFDASKHEPYSQEVTSILRDFLAELREKLEVLAPAERKLRMQYFMSVVPFMMQDNTFYNYIMHGFTNVQNPMRNLYTAMYLSNILEQGGFFEAADEEAAKKGVDYTASQTHDAADAFLKAHTHHDCSCGHDHHHDDHECCGGHHHDDDHECCGGHHHDDDHECCGGHDHACHCNDTKHH